jgi:hypothetical protein
MVDQSQDPNTKCRIKKKTLEKEKKKLSSHTAERDHPRQTRTGKKNRKNPFSRFLKGKGKFPRQCFSLIASSLSLSPFAASLLSSPRQPHPSKP